MASTMLAAAFLSSFLAPALAASIDIPTKTVAPGVEMPVMSIGTGGLESSKALDIVTDWLALGGRGIDTAFMYKDQGAVKDAINQSGIDRKSVFITSKIPGCLNARANVENDLQQLGTDYIDMLLIHFPTKGDVGCGEAWATLEEFHGKGVLKAIGVSNYKKSDLENLFKTAKVVPAVNQIEHNVLEHDDETIAFSLAHNVTVEAFSPLGRSNHSGDIPGNKVIQGIASSHQVSTYQVALRWILQHGHVLTFQSSSREHQKADADVFGFTLSSQDMMMLDNLTAVADVIQHSMVV